MKTIERKLSRRGFLKTSAASAGALAFVDRAFWSMTDGLVKMGVKPPWFKGEVRTTYNYCDICPFRCGIVVKSVGGRVFKIDGNPNDPKSRGKLCARGQAGVSFLYDPDRIKQPMIRVGERGEGKFRNATWEEALDYAAAGLKQLRDKYGQESLAVFGHTSGDFWFTDYFAQAFGTVNAAKPSVSMCTSPREEASILTTGRAIGNHEPVDWEAAKCIVLMGTHIGEDARNTLMQDLAIARANGAKLIVIDPRFSSGAMKADYWLQIKPGTDTALLLAWMNVLISERLIDTAFVEKWTVGFDQLAAHVRDLTPEWAAAITELPAALIRETARALGAARPSSVIVPGRHVIWYGNDTQRMRAVYMVMGLLGSYGRPGGLYFNKSPFIDEISHPPFLAASAAGGCGSAPGVESAPQPGPTGKIRADGLHERFMRGGTAIQELIEPMITGKPYPIKGLIAYGVNLFHTLPNRPRTIEALKKLDFVMVVDTLPQDHVAWADVVLPESTYLERYDELWGCGHKTPYLTMREPAIEPIHNTKPAWWMVRELGLRLGLDDFFQWETAEQYLNTRLSSIGLTLDKLRAMGGVTKQPGKPYLADFEADKTSPFTTQTEKLEFFSDALEKAGFAPMPVYEPTPDAPAGFFRLLYGRSPVHTFARTQNTPVLNAIMSENEVWINDQVASGLGLKQGDRVMLENQDGAKSGPIKVKATPRIRKDCVYMVHGFGHDAPGMTRAHKRGASDAALQTRYKLDPISGGAGLRINFVKLGKVA